MKKTRFLVLSAAAALLAACSGGTVTGPDAAGPRFGGTSIMGSGAFTTEPETGSTVQSGTGTTDPGATSETGSGGGTDDTSTRAGGTSMMGSGA